MFTHWLKRKVKLKSGSITKTHHQTVTISHRWTIENFDVYARGECEWKWMLRSDECEVVKGNGVKFELVLMVNEERGKRWLAVGVRARDVPIWWEKRVKRREVWSIEDADGERVERIEYAWKELVDDEILFDLQYLAITELLNPDTKLLLDGRLILHCEIILCSVELIFCPFSSSSSSNSFTNALSPVVTLSHRFSLAHFSLSYHRDDCCPLWFESNYFVPKNEPLGRFKIEVYPKGRSGDDAEQVAIMIWNGNAVGVTGYIKLSLLREDGQLYSVVAGEGRLVPNGGWQYSVSRHFLLDPANGLLPEDTLTVDCQLVVRVDGQIENQLQPDFKPQSSTSTVDVAHYQIHQAQTNWSIEQFREKHFEKTEWLESPAFGPSTARYSFSLHLYPKGSDGESEDDLMMILWNSRQLSEETLVQYRIDIENGEGKEWTAIIDRTTIFKVGEYAKRPLIARSTLLANSAHLLPDDTLTITCQLWIIENRKRNADQLYPDKAKDGNASTTIIKNSNLQSVNFAVSSSIKTGDITQQISPLPNTAQSTPSSTPSTSQQTTNVTTSTATDQLELVTTSEESPPNWEAMLDSLTTSNAAEYFYLTHQHQLPEKFKKKVVKKIRDNREAVIDSEGWTEFIKPNPDLFGELLKLI